MHKRFVGGLLAVSMALTAALGFAACGKDGGEGGGRTQTGGEIKFPDTPVAGTAGLAYALSENGKYYSSAGIGDCSETVIVISNAYNNFPVTGINKEAFSYCSDLASVTISEGVIDIGDYAFYACGGLTEVVVPDSVVSIGNSAFNMCGALTEITIPKSVTKIGSRVFYGCVKLLSVVFDGTKNEWMAVRKDANWHGNNDFTVQCTNGRFDSEGNEIE